MAAHFERGTVRTFRPAVRTQTKPYAFVAGSSQLGQRGVAEGLIIEGPTVLAENLERPEHRLTAGGTVTESVEQLGRLDDA